MSETMKALRELHTLATPEPSLLEAAKVVVALSGWSQVGPKREAYVTSAMAVAVLQAAIVREENPTFRLAPEPLPSGL